MEALQRIDIKILAAKGEDIPPFDFMPVFQRWIQDHTIPGVLIDVADYSHMHHGPGIILVAHEFNLSMDYAGGEMGLMYRRKQPMSGNLSERIHTVLADALEACAILEGEPEFQGRLQFDPGSIVLIANDRLLVSNVAESREVFRQQAEAATSALFGGGATYTFASDDPRERASLKISAQNTPSVRDLIAACRV